MASAQGVGPLAGIRVVEFASIGPGPHSAMLLADLGADVMRIDRPGGNGWPNPVVDRGRARRMLDIRTTAGRDEALGLASMADVLIEGFRPGVMERLGLGPEVVCDLNPRLIYGRMTGWGQTGPLSGSAGHDINYIALTGALAAIGRPGEPAVPPLNLVGDFGGGSMLLAFGIAAALLERGRSGRGQIIDAAIVDGTSSLMAMFAGMLPSGDLPVGREGSLLGGAAPFYRCYLCADGGEIAVGALEPHFYAAFVERVGAPGELVGRQYDRGGWPGDCAVLERLFAGRSSAHWSDLLEGTDCCAVAVVALADAPAHPHLRERGVYVMHDGVEQVAPVPRFSRTSGALRGALDAEEMLTRWRAEMAT